VNRFYRVGGGTRIAGFLLAISSMVLLCIGTGPISYIRSFGVFLNVALAHFFVVAVMVVGALIFVLGIDLVKEALWDTRHRVSRCVEWMTLLVSFIYLLCPELSTSQSPVSWYA
jgi:sulfate permease, SulP family